MNSIPPVTNRATNTKQIAGILLAAWLLALVLACTTASSPVEPNEPTPTSRSEASGSAGTVPAAEDNGGAASTPSETSGETKGKATGGGETASTASGPATTSSDAGTGDTQEAAGSGSTTETASASSGRRPPPGGDASAETRVGPSAPDTEAESVSPALPDNPVRIVLTISGGS